MTHPGPPTGSTHGLILAAISVVLVLFAVPAAAQINFEAARLERRGLEALAAGDLRTARASFEQAIEQDPDNPIFHLGVGAVAYQQQRNGDARLALTQALKLEPGLTTARALLARLRYQDGDLVRAIREMDTVVAAAPDDTASVETLGRWRRELALHDQMQQTLSDHFTVSYEGAPEAALAVQAVEALERAYWRIGQELSLYPLRPIPVVLYTNEQFRDITRSPDWAAGVYDGTTIRVPMRGALDNAAELERVLAHEFAHVLIDEVAPRNVPFWLHEGLASALEPGGVDWARQQIAQASQTLPLGMLGGSFERFTAGQAQLAYATSAVAVRRLLDEAGGIALANLLRDLGQGVPLAEAFEHRLYRPFDQFLQSGF